jgi:hypothetical protein
LTMTSNVEGFWFFASFILKSKHNRYWCSVWENYLHTNQVKRSSIRVTDPIIKVRVTFELFFLFSANTRWRQTKIKTKLKVNNLGRSSPCLEICQVCYRIGDFSQWTVRMWNIHTRSVCLQWAHKRKIIIKEIFFF